MGNPKHFSLLNLTFQVKLKGVKVQLAAALGHLF